jgi:hypothetical protein
MDGLPGLMWHLSDAWARRGEPNVLLIHYDDLSADLAGQMRGLARRLDIQVPETGWPALVQAATFSSMRAHSGRVVPSPAVLRSTEAFFRRGTSGNGAEVLTLAALEHYYARAAELAPADMLRWLHSPAEHPAAAQGRRPTPQ